MISNSQTAHAGKIEKIETKLFKVFETYLILRKTWSIRENLQAVVSANNFENIFVLNVWIKFRFYSAL